LSEYTYVAQKNKKRKKNQISNPAISNGENEKKFKKKKQVKPTEPVTCRHVSERGFIPVVSNGGNEENDKKKTEQKQKVGQFGK